MYEDKTKHEKRANGKVINFALVRELLKVKRSPLKQSYRATLNCCSVLEVRADGRIVSTFCKNRWCVNCGRIRSAKARNEYVPEVKKFREGMFVTLTKRTVTAKELRASIEKMEKAWRSILQSREGKRRKVKGIRKAECNVSKGNKHRFHYHLHVLLDGKENAEWLVSQWLDKMGSDATREAQDIREIDEGSYEELFKYATKSIAKTEDEEGFGFVSAVSLDWIYQCLKNKRTFQTFGGIRRFSEDIQDTDNEAITDDNKETPSIIETIKWSNDLRTWVHEDGTHFVEYKPKPITEKIIREDVKILVEA